MQFWGLRCLQTRTCLSHQCPSCSYGTSFTQQKPLLQVDILCPVQIFLRAGQMAELDKIRTELLNRSAVTLQRHARGFVKRSQYQRKRHAIVVLQARF